MIGTQRESRRQFMKVGMATGVSALGLVRIEAAEAEGQRKKLRATQVGRKIVVERSEKIYTTVGKRQQYNAFTNMDFWNGKYYVVFRQGVTHGGGDFSGRIVVLESTDLENWGDSVAMDQPSKDDRDPKLFSTPQRLCLYATTRGRGGVENTVVSFTEDGIKWSTPQQTYEDGYSFWKPKAHKGLYYAAADISGRAELLKSTDGINWQLVSIISDNYATTETSLVFLEDNRLLALSRQNSSPGGHWPGFSISSPPYTSWDYVLGNHTHFSGPAAALVGDTIVVASRTILPDWGLPSEQGLDDQRTALYTFNLKTMRLELEAMLPTETGGDSSYPGILPTGKDCAVVCWHDGSTTWHEPSPSNIWLAHIRVA